MLFMCECQTCVIKTESKYRIVECTVEEENGFGDDIRNLDLNGGYRRVHWSKKIKIFTSEPESL